MATPLASLALRVATPELRPLSLYICFRQMRADPSHWAPQQMRTQPTDHATLFPGKAATPSGVGGTGGASRRELHAQNIGQKSRIAGGGLRHAPAQARDDCSLWTGILSPLTPRFFSRIISVVAIGGITNAVSTLLSAHQD
jgi:hypothetical protein